MRIKNDNDPEQKKKSTETIGGEPVSWEFFSDIIYEWHKAKESHFRIHKSEELYNPDILLEKNYLNI